MVVEDGHYRGAMRGEAGSGEDKENDVPKAVVVFIGNRRGIGVVATGRAGGGKEVSEDMVPEGTRDADRILRRACELAATGGRDSASPIYTLCLWVAIIYN